MAYGKIKVDTITWDNSGTPTDIAVNTIPSTAGATYTGDLTLTGASANVVWDVSDNALEFADDAKAIFGAGSDLQIHHNGTDSNILGSQGDLYIHNTGSNADDINIRAQDDVLIQVQNGESAINCIGDGAVELYHDNSPKLSTSAAGVTVTGTVTDDKGELRTIPQVSKSAAHTIVASDSGKHSINTSGGWTFNTSTGFTAGQAITLINDSGSDQTVTNTGCTMYLGGDTSSKSTLTLKGRGIATFICTASNVYYGSGAGLE